MIVFLKRSPASPGSRRFVRECVPGCIRVCLRERGFAPLCLRLHACLILLSLIVTVVQRRPSLKLISHSGGFFV